MRKDIYIVGDGTKEYGAKIIKYLESLGGNNIEHLNGDTEKGYYFIQDNNNIDISISKHNVYNLIEITLGNDGLPLNWGIRGSNELHDYAKSIGIDTYCKGVNVNILYTIRDGLLATAIKYYEISLKQYLYCVKDIEIYDNIDDIEVINKVMEVFNSDTTVGCKRFVLYKKNNIYYVAGNTDNIKTLEDTVNCVIYTWKYAREISKVEIPKINNYDGTIINNDKDSFIIKYGCVEINLNELTKIFMSNAIGSRTIKSITLDSDVVIDIDTFNDLVKVYKEYKN